MLSRDNQSHFMEAFLGPRVSVQNHSDLELRKVLLNEDLAIETLTRTLSFMGIEDGSEEFPYSLELAQHSSKLTSNRPFIDFLFTSANR